MNIPYDLQLNVVKHLSIKDAINYGKSIEKENNIRSFILSDEYCIFYRKKNIIQKIQNIMLLDVLHSIADIANRYKNSVLKPVRLNTENGTMYTLFPNDINNSVYISNIIVPDIIGKTFSFSYQNIGRNTTQIYYGGLELLIMVIDNVKTKTRNLFVRMPYECEEYIYGFAGSVIQTISNIINVQVHLSREWKVNCEYMLCRNSKSRFYVNVVSSTYKTRGIDPIYHIFFEKILNIYLRNQGYSYIVKPWDIYSVFKQHKALMIYPSYIEDSIEVMFQELGFPNNVQVATNIFLNNDTLQFYEIMPGDDGLEVVDEN